MGRGGTSPSLSSSQCALLLPKNAFSSQNCLFIFQKCPFVSWNFPFVFQKCLSISQKCPSVFQNCPLVFQNSFLFILRAFFQERLLFPANCTFSSPYSEQLRVGRGEGTALLLFFPPWNSLLTDLWCLLHNLGTSTWSIIFCISFKF